MKKLVLCFALVLCALQAAAQGDAPKRYALYGVAFYNLENLFDTLHAPGKNDYEYLPGGTNAWGSMKYRAKVKNMSEALADICRDKLPNGAAVIGVSEVENRQVVEDVVAAPALASRGYKVVHYEGPDRRGVDCALIYNPRYFKLESSMLVPYYYKDPAQPDVDLGFYEDSLGRVVPYEELRGDTTHITRGFLVATGKLAGETFHFIVNHWPSRFAGSEVRERAGYQVHCLKDALLRQYPYSKVIIMGDMNDDPGNASMSEALGCLHDPKEVKQPGQLYNPWWEVLYKKGRGTLRYRGNWNLFDQIVFTGNLLNGDRTSLTYHSCHIFAADYLFQREGQYKGSPLRTHAGGVWLNGYSDHLPTYIYLIKEKK